MEDGTMYPDPMQEMINEINFRWANGTLVGSVASLPPTDYPDLPWVPYENCLRAQLVHTKPDDDIGRVIVAYPAKSKGPIGIRMHPESDRVVTVAQGSGTFIVFRDNTHLPFDLRPGTRLWIPRMKIYTICPDSSGMIVHAIHTPWIMRDSARHILYPNV